MEFCCKIKIFLFATLIITYINRIIFFRFLNYVFEYIGKIFEIIVFDKIDKKAKY